MTRRSIRWVGRVLGASGMVAVVLAAIGLLDQTLISNMDRFSAVGDCVAIIIAAVVIVRWFHHVYFTTPTESDEPPVPDLTINLTIEQSSAPASVPEAAASGGERQTEQTAGKVMWV